MDFKDHFSGHAALYRRYRPTYPAAVFASLAARAPRRALAWDAGAGNGQAALLLAEHFDSVVATDPSAEQLGASPAHPRVRYDVSPAERSGLPDASVDLCISAQALHWFDFEGYWAEVRRVSRPGALLAALTYNHPRVSAAVDVVLDAYIASILGDWPPERRHVNAGYATIPIPFRAVAPESWPMERLDDFEAFWGYCATWSAAQRASRRLGADPRAPFEDAMREAWGDPTQRQVVRWPLTVFVGTVA